MKKTFFLIFFLFHSFIAVASHNVVPNNALTIIFPTHIDATRSQGGIAIKDVQLELLDPSKPELQDNITTVVVLNKPVLQTQNDKIFLGGSLHPFKDVNISYDLTALFEPNENFIKLYNQEIERHGTTHLRLRSMLEGAAAICNIKMTQPLQIIKPLPKTSSPSNWIIPAACCGGGLLLAIILYFKFWKK